MDEKYFKKAERFYRNNFYLLKNSSVLKDELRNACDALDITYYSLPKCHGTRFVNHRKKGFIWLLHLWPAFVTVYRNAEITTSNAKTRAKISGLLKKFTDVRELLRVVAFLEVVEMVSVASLVFEKKDLLPFEIETSIKITQSKISQYIENEDNPDSKLSFFNISQSEKSKCDIERNYPKAGQERKKETNRETKSVTIDGLTFSKNCVSVAQGQVMKIAKAIKRALAKRFEEF